MKNFIVLSTLLISSSAFAATQGTLLLKGHVSKKVSIVVAAEAVASAIDLETNQSNLKVATVTEKSNSNAGYTVAIKSANLGKLKRSGGSETFNYSLTYAGAAVNLSAAAGQTFTDSSVGPVTNTKDLAISYAGIDAVTMAVGDYEDLLTLDIAAI